MKPSDETPSPVFDSVDPPRNFSLSVNERIRALTIGAPAFAMRKRSIEDTEEKNLRALSAMRERLLRNGASTSDVRAALEAKAASLDLEKLNALIATHNRYYPIEANLPTDPRTGGYLIYGKPWCPERPWTTTRLVEHVLALASGAHASNAATK